MTNGYIIFGFKGFRDMTNGYIIFGFKGFRFTPYYWTRHYV